VLPRENLRVEETVFLSGDGLRIGLAAYFDANSAGKEDVFWDERVVEGIEVECGILWLASHRRRRHRASRERERERERESGGNVGVGSGPKTRDTWPASSLVSAISINIILQFVAHSPYSPKH
jgi:hypothetical protein